MVGDILDVWAMIWPVKGLCRRHSALLEAFFDEREQLVLGVTRLRKSDRRFGQRFEESERRVLDDGVPPMFTLRPALRDLEQHGDAPRQMIAAANRANSEVGALLPRPDWASPVDVAWSGAFAAAALVAHADDAPDARLAAIGLMRVGIGNRTVEPRRFAHIVDRDAAMSGRDQIYGTLFVPIDGTPQGVWPMPPEAEVNDARQSIGLPPMSHDRMLYEHGARPGPFLIPSTRKDAAVLNARLSISYMRHGKNTRRLFPS